MHRGIVERSIVNPRVRARRTVGVRAEIKHPSANRVLQERALPRKQIRQGTVVELVIGHDLFEPRGNRRRRQSKQGARAFGRKPGQRADVFGQGFAIVAEQFAQQIAVFARDRLSRRRRLPRKVLRFRLRGGGRPAQRGEQAASASRVGRPIRKPVQQDQEGLANLRFGFESTHTQQVRRLRGKSRPQLVLHHFDEIHTISLELINLGRQTMA